MHADENRAPQLIVIAGPNGAGKTTIARDILQGPFQVEQFVNADIIAQGLSAFDPQAAAWEAGRIMLSRLDELARRRADIAFETTLASRSFAPWISAQLEEGYEFHLVFLWLPSADMAVRRVRDRVERGGHEVPEETVRRRFARGLSNFQEIYRELANSWQVADNSGRYPKRIAHDERFDQPIIDDPELRERFLLSAKS